jgi:hypothetical protein
VLYSFDRIDQNASKPGLSGIALLLFSVALAVPVRAEVLFYSGNLRSNANITGCGPSCTLDPINDSDATYAQWAAFSVSFLLNHPFDVTAVTYSYGGGASLTGPIVAAGGFEPYFSLFDGSGNFLASTYLGVTCPPGANTFNGFCYDVKLDAGVLPAGSYTLVLSEYTNILLAENLGSPYKLADGMTGLGNLNGTENLKFAFDLILPASTTAAPEPASGELLLMGIALVAVARPRRVRARSVKKGGTGFSLCGNVETQATG